MRKYFKIPRPAKSEILAPAVPGEGARRDELAYRARGEGARAHLDEGVEVGVVQLGADDGHLIVRAGSHGARGEAGGHRRVRIWLGLGRADATTRTLELKRSTVKKPDFRILKMFNGFSNPEDN